MRRATLLAAVLLASGIAGLAFAEQGNDDQAKSQANVDNDRPSVVRVDVLTDDGQTGGAQVSPEAGGQRTVEAEVDVRDRNNHQDVVRVECSILDAESGDHGDVEADPDGGNGNRGTWALDFAIDYHDPPGDWNLTCRAWDQQMIDDGQTPAEEDEDQATFTVLELAAARVDDDVVDFTAGEPIEPDTRTDPTSIEVENVGNVEIDLRASATALEGPDDATIPPGNVRVGYDEAMSGAQWLDGEVEMDEFGLAPGEGSTDEAWFTLDVPSGEDRYVPPGDYEGEVVLGAVHAGD